MFAYVGREEGIGQDWMAWVSSPAKVELKIGLRWGDERGGEDRERC